MGLLDSPENAALLQLGLGLLSAGGPSRTPISLGQAIGSAGGQAMDAYRQTEAFNAQKKARALQEQLQQMQLGEAQRKAQAIQGVRNQLPEQLRPVFDLDPAGFMSRLQKEDKPMVVGRTLMKPDGTVIGSDVTWKDEQEAARKAREAEARMRQQERLDMFGMQQQGRQDMLSAQLAGRRDMANLAASLRPQEKQAKLPTSALKMQQEELDAISTSASLNADLGAFKEQIKARKLDLGPVANKTNALRNMLGVSSEESRNLATFQASLEKMRNDSLRLNKGVQTEGDAVRAWNELLANINDPQVVTQRLDEIQKINERAIGLRKMNIDAIRSNFGVDPMDVSGFANQAPAVGQSVRKYNPKTGRIE